MVAIRVLAVTVLPASAGMIPKTTPAISPIHSAPRICGDDPEGYANAAMETLCSPHLRG